MIEVSEPHTVDCSASRNLLLELGERTTAFSYLIPDRAGKITAAFDTVLVDANITVLKIPPRSPRAREVAQAWMAAHELRYFYGRARWRCPTPVSTSPGLDGPPPGHRPYSLC